MKLSWTWLAVGLFVLLALAFVVRERFTTYEEALRDVGQAASNVNPICPTGSTQNSDRTECTVTTPEGTTEVTSPTCPTGTAFVSRGYTLDLDETVCETTGPDGSTETSPPTCPDGSTFVSRGATEEPGCKTVKEDGSVTMTPPVCPAGSSFVSRRVQGLCEPTSGQSSESAPVPGSSGAGADTASSTGGSSGTRFGPNSASKGGRNVWGPVFKGLGEGDGPVGGDSTKTNPYPALMGGMGGRASTRIEGVGIVPPSGVGLGGVMPSSSALGTDANSRFLPYSRQPGDMDVVADPYRLASNFSASSYSASKTDPVPFLTDFSAFYR